MKKKLLIAIIATLCLLGPSKAWADEIDVDCVADPTNAACIVTTSDDSAVDAIAEPTDCIEDDATDCAPVEESPLEEEMNCIGSPDMNCEPEIIAEEEEAEDSEPALWPMYVSLGALGAAILVFIILNLFGGKKK